MELPDITVNLKKMKIILLLICLLTNLTLVFGQERLLIKANKNIYEYQLEEALSLIEKYKKKEGPSNATTLLEIKIAYYKSKSIEEIEICESRLAIISQTINQFTDEIPKFYIKIGLDPDSLSLFSAKLNTEISKHYLSSNNIEQLNYFINKYPYSQEKLPAVMLRDSIIYFQIEKSPDINVIEQFIQKYPNSHLLNSALELVETLYYNEAIKENTISSLNKFIKKFPDTNKKQKINQLLEDLEWNEALKKNSITSYQYFLINYPYSIKKSEINDKIQDIEWSIVQNSISKKSLENFQKNYPYSRYENDINESLANLEKLDYNTAINSNSIQKLVDFKTNYPNNPNIGNIDLVIKDLKSLVLPFLGADRKYRLYDIEIKQYHSLEYYDQAHYLATGHLLLVRDALSTILDLKGKTIIPFVYPCISNTKKEQYIVFQKGKYGLISKQGINIVSPIYNEIYDNLAGPYYEVTKGIGKNRKVGIIDTSGKIIIPLEYEYIQQPFEKFPQTFICNNGKLYQLINTNGEKLGSQYKQLWSLDSDGGYIVTHDTQKYGLIDQFGKEIFPLKWESISYGNMDHFILQNEKNEFGIYDINNIELFPFQKLNDIFHLDKDLYAINTASNSNFPIIMVYNTTIKRFLSGKETYRAVSFLGSDLFSAEIGTSVKFFNHSWEELNEIKNAIKESTTEEAPYEDYDHGYEGDDYEGDASEYAEYGCNLSWTEAISLLDHSQVIESSSDLISVYIDGHYGFVDANGVLKIPNKYISGEKFKNELATVTISDSNEIIYQIIDRSGKIVLSDYTINGLSKMAPNRYLLYSNKTSSYAWYNHLLKKVSPMDKSIQNYLEFENFNCLTYKDVDIFITKNGDTLLDQNISFNKYYASNLINKALNLFYEDKYTESIKLLNEALKFTPSDPEIFGNLSDCYLAKGNLQEALSFVNQGLDYEINESLLIKRKEIYLKQNKNKDAADDYISLAEFSIKEKSEKWQIGNYFFSAGYEYLQCKQYQDAINAINKGIKYDKDKAWAYNNRGVCYNHLGKDDLALVDFQKAIAKCNGCSEAGLYFNNSGKTFKRLNRKDEACDYFRRAANIDSKYNNDYRQGCK